MEPWGTLVLTGYSCEGFPAIAKGSCLLLRKAKIKISTNIWPESPGDLSLWRRLACQILSKSLISSATDLVDPDLLEALTTATTSAIDWQDLAPYHLF